MFSGDFAQLRPIGDRAIYAKSDYFKDNEAAGARAYATFNRAVFLTEMMRQIGIDESCFRSILHNVRAGNISEEEIVKLSTRNVTELTESEQMLFVEKGIFIFAERQAANAYNE